MGKLRDQCAEGPEVEQRTFEQVQVVDVLAVDEVNFVSQERVRKVVGSYETSWWKGQRSSSGSSSRCRWWMVLRVGKTGISSPVVER